MNIIQLKLNNTFVICVPGTINNCPDNKKHGPHLIQLTPFEDQGSKTEIDTEPNREIWNIISEWDADLFGLTRAPVVGHWGLDGLWPCPINPLFTSD